MQDFQDTEFDAIRTFPELVAVGFDMERGTLRYSERGMSNHTMRDVLVGLWLRLGAADRRDFIKELQHYSTPGSEPSGLSVLISTVGREHRSRRP